MRNRSVVANRIYDLLLDSAWHDREEITQALLRCVPPGKAIREQEANRSRLIARRRQKGMPEGAPNQPLTTQRAIEVGGRIVVNKLVRTSVRNGFVERREREGRQQLRLIRAPKAYNGNQTETPGGAIQ